MWHKVEEIRARIAVHPPTADEVDFYPLVLVYEDFERLLSNLDFKVALGFIGTVIQSSA